MKSVDRQRALVPHCGMRNANACPTGAWDMQKFYLEMSHAGHACAKHA